MKYLLLTILSFNLYPFFKFKTPKRSQYLGFRHLHIESEKKALNFMKDKIVPFIEKGRVNVYRIIDWNFKYENAPMYVKEQFFPLDLKSLKVDFKIPKKRMKKSAETEKKLNELSLENFKKYLEDIIAHGSRSDEGIARDYIVGEFEKNSIEVLDDTYNIVGLLKGTSNKNIVIVGHMDTVKGTVGADDNASGTAGVLELSRVLSKIYLESKGVFNIIFLVSENEESGLLGAKKFVKKLKAENKLDTIEYFINMDMIGYNQNGIIDLETKPEHREIANYFSELALNYTDLTPNLVLEPWGSDHIPFLNEGVPGLLTIESWETHTPCWHKSCDTIETINFEYAMSILKVNLASVLDYK